MKVLYLLSDLLPNVCNLNIVMYIHILDIFLLDERQTFEK